MKKILRYTTNALFVIGLILAFLAVGTSDYYVIELGIDHPQYVWRMLGSSVAMMVPMIFRVIFTVPEE